MEGKSEHLNIEGMSCQNCERHIKEALEALTGVLSVKASYKRSRVDVEYDPDLISHDDLVRAVEMAGYQVRDGNPKIRWNAAGIALLVLALYMLLQHSGIGQIANVFPTATENTGYGMLFVIGLLTSVHCIAMCGGINLTQCIPSGARASDTSSALRPGLLYNLGRVVSYTVVGGLAGAVGSVVSFSGAAKGFIQLFAGVFMVLMGLNMLGVIPGLTRLVPHLPASLGDRLQKSADGNGPLVVGLLNGFMPCGPLQAMQLYALSTGSPLRGAISMLLFSLGTVPLMLGLSVFSSIMSRRFTRRVMSIGAALVVVLGISMFQTGLALSGFSVIPVQVSSDSSTANVQSGIQYVNTTLESGRYQPITVEVGVPVIWTITADPGTVNGCNNRMFIPEYGIEQRLGEGENVIEFLPAESGVFRYSCWMGMIRSTITVTENGQAPNVESQLEPEYRSPVIEYSGRTCC